IVTIGYPVAGLRLLGYQSFPASLELVNGDSLDHVPLTGHQRIDTRQCPLDALAESCNLNVISDVAVRRRLPGPDKSLVLLSESIDLCVQFIQVRMRVGESLLVLGFLAPSERAAQARRALPKREKLTVVRISKLLLDESDTLTGNALLRGRQIIWARRSQHRLQTLAEVLALFESQANPGIQLLELPVDLGQ